MKNTNSQNARTGKNDWLTNRYGSGDRVNPNFKSDRQDRKRRFHKPNRKQEKPVVKDVVVPASPAPAPKKEKKPFVQKLVDLRSFKWPEYVRERDRIRANSMKYKHVDVSDAFAAEYGVRVHQTDGLHVANIVPTELKVGDLMKVRVLEVSKSRVIFDVPNIKTDVVSNVNLYKYPFFKRWLPVEPIEVQVVSVTRDKVVVDPISPLVDHWLRSVIDDPTNQRRMDHPQSILVRDLRQTRGGFMGRAVVPNVSEFVGEEFTIDAFIPGSQIVLNITDNYNEFEGKSVETFALNYIAKPGRAGQSSLICSVKEYKKFLGEMKLVDLFKEYCENSSSWKKFKDTPLTGMVTGVINSNKKCGVFVELPDLNITGMVATDPEQLSEYEPFREVSIKFDGFDEETYYNEQMDQMQHEDPFVIEDGILRKITVKPVFKFA